jgi:endoglucanase
MILLLLAMSSCHCTLSFRVPLKTDAQHIVDADGVRVRLSCVSWYGAEGEDFVVGGLQLQPVEEVVKEIASLGFNCVRLPFSLALVHKDPPLNASKVRANPSLQNGMQAYDAVVRAVTLAGIMVILDNHNSDAIWCCDGDDGNGSTIIFDFLPLYSF